jgi:hypothetical protein
LTIKTLKELGVCFSLDLRKKYLAETNALAYFKEPSNGEEKVR